MMMAAPLLGMPIPLTAVQLLWINLVTDGLPALALGVEPPNPDAMRRPPFPPDESVLARGMGTYMLWVGALLGLSSIAAQYLGIRMGSANWQTMVFTTLALSQMGNALAVRSDRDSLFRLGLRSNMALVGAVLLTVLLQAAVVYVPFLQDIFGTHALSWSQLGISLALSAIVFVAVEIAKWVRRRHEPVSA
jgi:Ca2+-transporting ATPase